MVRPAKSSNVFILFSASFTNIALDKKLNSIKSFEKKTKPGGAGGIPTPAHILTIADKKGEEFQLEYKTPKIWPTFYAVIDFQLPGNESTIGPLKVGESFELELEPGVKYEVVNLEGTLENGLKLRKPGPDGASTSDITVSAGKKNG